MEITIKCNCQNEIIIPAPAGKYTQLRDYLETKLFSFGTTKIKNVASKHFKTECDECKKQITLCVD